MKLLDAILMKVYINANSCSIKSFVNITLITSFETCYYENSIYKIGHINETSKNQMNKLNINNHSMDRCNKKEMEWKNGVDSSRTEL